jgi:hypothetical protein
LISGDYSAATDNLKIEVTKTIFEVVLAKLVEDLDYSDEAFELVTLCRKVLYEHQLSYPKKYGIEPLTQATGQLMGSVLSFPILCLANCICCWISLYPEVDSLERLPILVNGDDITFSCTRSRYKHWCESLADFGFVKSVGKNYCHKRFMIINSELFDSKYQQTGHCHLPYFASGLLLGRHKVGKSETQTESDFEETEEEGPPIVTTLDLVLRGACNKQRALLRFMHYNLRAVEQVTQRKLNLFLPRCFGGLALSSYGLKNHISLWQRRYATYLSKQKLVSLPGFKRDARESKQFLPIRSVRFNPWDVDADLDFKSKLNAVAHNFWLGSRERRDELRREGPTGSRIADPDGETVWSGLSGCSLRTINRCAPMPNLEGEVPRFQLHCRYTVSVPDCVRKSIKSGCTQVAWSDDPLL